MLVQIDPVIEVQTVLTTEAIIEARQLRLVDLEMLVRIAGETIAGLELIKRETKV